MFSCARVGLGWFGYWSAPLELAFIGFKGAGTRTLLKCIESNVDVNETEGYTQIPLNFNHHILGSDISNIEARKNLPELDGIIFIVDSSNDKCIKEAKELLESIGSDSILGKLPIVVFLNKIDIRLGDKENTREAILEEGKPISKEFLAVAKNPVGKIFPASFLKNYGWRKGMMWMYDKTTP